MVQPEHHLRPHSKLRRYTSALGPAIWEMGGNLFAGWIELVLSRNWYRCALLARNSLSLTASWRTDSRRSTLGTAVPPSVTIPVTITVPNGKALRLALPAGPRTERYADSEPSGQGEASMACDASLTDTPSFADFSSSHPGKRSVTSPTHPFQPSSIVQQQTIFPTVLSVSQS